ncbi:MAG: hypothetical protein JWQ21_256 [Herminiimonas sp.]|nr:hypothetical protein [Herminiimonas sp.]
MPDNATAFIKRVSGLFRTSFLGCKWLPAKFTRNFCKNEWMNFPHSAGRPCFSFNIKHLFPVVSLAYPLH